MLGQDLGKLSIGGGEAIGAAFDLVRDFGPQQVCLDVFVLGVEQLGQGLQGGVGVTEVELKFGDFLEGADVGGVGHQTRFQHFTRFLEGSQATLGGAFDGVGDFEVRNLGADVALNDGQRFTGAAIKVAPSQQHQGLHVARGSRLRAGQDALGLVDLPQR